MLSDAELLRRYAESADEGAFTELVQRHIKVVYSAALRQVDQDRALAEDVTQLVYTDLARKAAALSRHPLLIGWLYQSTRFAASKAARSRQQRAFYENQAAMQHSDASDESPLDWERAQPVIDSALGELSEQDRHALLLRFFEDRPFADIAAKLQLSEDAARMRVRRALDSARAALRRHGIASSASALATALASHAVAAEPAGLAAAVSQAAIAGSAASAGLGSFSLFLHAMSVTKITVVTASFAALLFLGAALYENRDLRRLASQSDETSRQIRDLNDRLRREHTRTQELQSEITRLKQAAAQVASMPLAPTAGTARMTKAAVDARYKHALDLAKSGDSVEALRELLWCYDEGFPRISAYRFARNRTLLREIAKLAEANPAAATALRERADEAGKAVMASAFDFEAAADFVAINRVLHAEDFTLALYDQLAPDDRRRSALSRDMYDTFVGAQRYSDALKRLSYSQMTAGFNALSNVTIPPDSTVAPEQIRRDAHQELVATTTQNIETLAGSGDLAHAQELIKKLLAADSSSETRDLLLQHLQRAGHADLLLSAPNG